MGKVQEAWDLEFDVVVIGYGFAGGWAAMTAHDSGASVAIFEKMRHFGGNSILAGGGCAYGTDYEATLAHLEATSGGATDQRVLGVFAREMCDLKPELDKFAASVGTTTRKARGGPTYPYPGAHAISICDFKPSADYHGFPWVTGASAGAVHFWILHENVTRRGIPQYYGSPAERLITDCDGTVIGVAVRREGRELRVRSLRGVILASGGFEHNANLITQHMRLREAYAMSPLGNTGDGVLMAQKAGAALWHMWHVHGSYGFRLPGVPVAIRTPFGGFRNDPSRAGTGRKMPWIAVDKFGKRFMNEWPRAAADTPIRDLDCYDFDLLDYPRIPCYLIFDEEGRKLGPIGDPKFNDESLSYEWSEDNLRELASGTITRHESIQELATAIRVDRNALSATVARWNDHCAHGTDSDFGRTPDAMMPLLSPPFYAIEAWPIISNTQGGPVHDAAQRVLDPYGEPIPHLYEAGELGSIWGHVYLLAGNITEAVIGGRIAGREAAAETPLPSLAGCRLRGDEE